MAVEIARFEAPGRGWWVYAAPVVQFSADGTRLASGNDRGGARSVDLATGVSVIVGPATAGMSSMTWIDAIVAARGQAGGTRISRFGVYSPDGGLFATGSTAPVPFRGYRGGLDGEIAYELDHRVEAVAISPDGRLLAATAKDGVVRLYDAATGAPRGELVGHVGPTWAAAFHPHQPLIATGGEDSIIRLWDTQRCEPLLELRGHEQYVMDLQFSPDGTMLVSGSGDFTVRLWDALPRAERQRRASEARDLRERQRERVETLLREFSDPARVAERLRADPTLDDAQRKAALRVLLETAASAGDRAGSSGRPNSRPNTDCRAFPNRASARPPHSWVVPNMGTSVPKLGSTSTP